MGESVTRLDAYEKVTGRAKYTGDLIERGVLCARLLRSTIANGRVLRIETAGALEIEGVVKIVTCFDVPDIAFATAGHPWSEDPSHQDVADRRLLNARVRLYGDEIAAVIARDEIAAARALRAIRVEYAEEPPALTCADAIKAAEKVTKFPSALLFCHVSLKFC